MYKGGDTRIYIYIGPSYKTTVCYVRAGYSHTCVCKVFTCNMYIYVYIVYIVQLKAPPFYIYCIHCKHGHVTTVRWWGDKENKKMYKIFDEMHKVDCWITTVSDKNTVVVAPLFKFSTKHGILYFCRMVRILCTVNSLTCMLQNKIKTCRKKTLGTFYSKLIKLSKFFKKSSKIFTKKRTCQREMGAKIRFTGEAHRNLIG
jgi:hypothetical protein